ncbi:MAG: hypothetical protein K0U41_06365 [Gammaproteobacteria bacterium]|nr:hypothetical protein [Gammaproteobacteria bacterium]
MNEPRNLGQEIKSWYRKAPICLLFLVSFIITLICSTFLGLVFNYTFVSPIYHQIANIFEAAFFTSIMGLVISAIWTLIVYTNS